MKLCKGPCKQVKEDSKFYVKRYKNGTVGLRSYCIECGQTLRDLWLDKNFEQDNARNKAYNRKHALKIRGRKLTKYWPGTTWQQALEKYAAARAEQNGVCAICKRPERRRHAVTGTLWDLAVDHCHETGIVRGLLCNACNRGIGLLGDTDRTLSRVVEYLAKNKKLT